MPHETGQDTNSLVGKEIRSFATYFFLWFKYSVAANATLKAPSRIWKLGTTRVFPVVAVFRAFITHTIGSFQ